MGKETAWNPLIDGCSVIVSSSYTRCLQTAAIRLMNHAVDPGAVIVLLFVAMLLYVILCVAALFPATWRMTDKEKEKILDKDENVKTDKNHSQEGIIK